MAHPPKVKLDIMGKLSLPTVKPELYFESKLHNELFIKPPNMNYSDKPVELIAIHCHQEHERMVELQEECLERDRNQNKINKNRIKEVFQTQDQIRESFIEVNNFFKDCDEKKKFARNKVSEERQIHNKLKTAINDTKHKIEVLSDFRDVFKKALKKFETYEVVIQEVVDSKDNNWNTPKEVIDGCDALMMAQCEMIEMQAKTIRKIEFVRCKMYQIQNEAMMTVLGLKNELAALERDYDETHSECLQLEYVLINTKNSINDRRIAKCQTLNEINNIYKTLCRRRGMSPAFSRANFEAQLSFIKEEINIIRHVIQECSNSRKLKKPKKKNFI